MEAIKCDRCGILSEKIEYKGVRITEWISHNRSADWIKKDLCTECNDSLKKWWLNND